MAKGPGFLTLAELVFLIMAILLEIFMILHWFSIEDFEIIYILGLFCNENHGAKYANQWNTLEEQNFGVFIGLGSRH